MSPPNNTKEPNDIVESSAQLALNFIIRFARSASLAVRTPGAVARAITAGEAESRLLHPISFALLAYILFSYVLGLSYRPSNDMRMDPAALDSATQFASIETIVKTAFPLLCWVALMGWLVGLMFNWQLRRNGTNQTGAINRDLASKAWLRVTFVLSGLHFSVLSLMMALVYLLWRLVPEGKATDMIVMAFIAVTLGALGMHTFLLPAKLAPAIARACDKIGNVRTPLTTKITVAAASTLLFPGYAFIGFMVYSASLPYVHIISTTKSEEAVLSLNLVITNPSSYQNLFMANIMEPIIDIGQCEANKRTDENTVSVYLNKLSGPGIDGPDTFLLTPGASTLATVTWERGRDSGSGPGFKDLDTIRECSVPGECCCQVRLEFLNPTLIDRSSQWHVCFPDLD